MGDPANDPWTHAAAILMANTMIPRLRVIQIGDNQAIQPSNDRLI